MSYNVNISSSEIKDTKNNIYNLIFHDITNNPLDLARDDYEDYITNNILELLLVQFEPILNKYDLIDQKYFLLSLIEHVKLNIYTKLIPRRSFDRTYIRVKPDINKISQRINYLDNLELPPQRTQEWYEFRHNMISASSIWKVFSTESHQNQLIHEKCTPFIQKNDFCPIDSPLEWGHKYEPLSVLWYEDQYKTKVGDYGCIKHPKYSFIGASPDGINIDPKNMRYGRMLEIKNPVTRKITGIPKFEYWIQMQIQMETCDFNECDFLETKFVEYNSEREFLEDGTFNLSADGKNKGCIIVFTENGRPHYEYSPANISLDEYNKWREEMEEKNKDKSWFSNVFWKLETVSCILVLRNKLWFKHAIKDIKKIWDVIEYEKVNGFSHRQSKRQKTSFNQNKPQCLFKNIIKCD